MCREVNLGLYFMKFSEQEIIREGLRTLEIERNELQSVIERIGPNFAQAVELLLEARKIVVSGVGKSGIIAQKIAATISSTGFPALFMHPVDALHGDIGIVERGDCAVLLSKSGSTEEITRLAPFLRSRGAKIIVIVGNPDSYLANMADVMLDVYVESEGCPLNIAPMASALVSLAIGDALAACLMKARNITVEDFSRQHPLGQIGRNITLTVADVMHKNDSLPLIPTGSSFKEAVIEITNKRLGCVCVVDSDGKLLGIITDGDVRRTLQKFEDFRGLNVDDVMTKNPIKIQPNLFLGEALSLMTNRESQIGVLPVVAADNKCIGVIRVHDIVRSGI